jgi:phosphatidylinositol phospholipase C beta
LFLLIEVADFVPNSWSELAQALSNPIKYQSELEKRDHQLSVLRDDFYNENQQTGPNVESETGNQLNSPAKSPQLVIGQTNTKNESFYKDTKDRSISQTTDNKKTLPANTRETTISTLETITLKQDSIENIFKHKSVKEKETELVCRIENLAKKFQKEIAKLDTSKNKYRIYDNTGFKPDKKSTS